ncbi:hypothetical protein [uncultured Nostoc sp.]|uniref:hypothetical protein n=1 Tax=uncultured Nostoc sp. TaxID=340711 RepID=UPI0035CA76BE
MTKAIFFISEWHEDSSETSVRAILLGVAEWGVVFKKTEYECLKEFNIFLTPHTSSAWGADFAIKLDRGPAQPQVTDSWA